MASLLIIDDDKMICSTMCRVFADSGHEAVYALTLEDGLKKAKTGRFDVIFLDVRLPDGDGLNYLPMIQTVPSLPEVIIVTGYADADGAELAIKNNAWDYIKKPASIDTIMLTLKRAIQYREEKFSSQPKVNLIRDGIIGESGMMKTCLDLVARAANANVNILITGETGTGKELFARAIHANSPRADKNFVVVDCSSLPETLVESLLFGHTKGAFTGADRAEEGLIKCADKGTLFLDEIGELSLSSQKVLLRVLQEHRFHPVGGTQEIKSDFRLVAATNRNLDEMATAKKFREDLLFRLRSITINLPPLRERIEDIKEIAINYMTKLCESYKIGIKGFSPEFFDFISSYHWPGNVRELQGALEWAVMQAIYEPTLFPKHLPTRVRVQAVLSSFDDPAPAINTSDQALMKWRDFRKSIIDQGEKSYLESLISRVKDIREATDLSGLSQPRLYELLRKHNLSLK